MKTIIKSIKAIIAAMALIIAVPAVAQKENKQIENETLVKTYSIETSKGTMDYSVRIDSKMADWVSMEKDELDQKEQTRVMKPKKITKMISVMSSEDPKYDNVLYLTYRGTDDDHLKVYPTKEGFALKVVGKVFNYRLLDRDYYIDESSVDFFEVNMQDSK